MMLPSFLGLFRDAKSTFFTALAKKIATRETYIFFLYLCGKYQLV